MATILVIDDSEPLQKIVSVMLARTGHTSFAACDGVEGLRALRASAKPLVVLAGLNMPIMDGHEMLAEVAKDPVLSSRHVYIPFSASSKMTVMVERLQRIAPPPYLSLAKPFTLQQLVTVVEHGLRGLRARLN